MAEVLSVLEEDESTSGVRFRSIVHLLCKIPLIGTTGEQQKQSTNHPIRKCLRKL